jgi:hypothetical protein
MTLHTAQNKEAQREQTIAKQAGAQKLEEIRAQPFANIQTMYASPNNLFPVPGLQNPGYLPTQQGRGTITIDNSNPNLLDITVTIEWVSPRGTSRYVLKSLYTR